MESQLPERRDERGFGVGVEVRHKGEIAKEQGSSKEWERADLALKEKQERIGREKSMLHGSDQKEGRSRRRC